MKISLGPKNCLYPLPTVLVGAHVGGKPNFNTMAHVGILDFSTIAMGMNRTHHTAAGIRENRMFSVNFPTTAMVREADYCGLVSGKRVDKAKLFEIHYGKLAAAPLIRRCPLSMECRLAQVIELPRHDVFLGEIVETWADESIVVDGEVDYAKLDPILFIMSGHGYFRLGERFAQAWDVGKELAGR